MKLTAKTLARLALPAGKTDSIFFDDELPGFGLRLRASGDRVRRSWVVQYRRAGGQRRMLLGNADLLDADKARKLAEKALAKVTLGEDPQADKIERRQRDKHSLKALIDDYLAWKASSGVRSRTITEVERYLRGSYFRPLHAMPVDRIGRKDVAQRVLHIARESGARTAAAARSALSACYVWALQHGLAESNPFVGTVPPKAAGPRERVLSDAELAAVWRACPENDFGRIVRLLILTAQRRSEVGGASWAELKPLDRGAWSIPASRTKNHRAHTVPLSALALSIIAAVPERVGRAHLFGDRAARGFTSWVDGKRDLDARSGVTAWTLHDIRRSAATRMCDLGVAPHVVEQLLNHQSGHRSGIAGIYNRSRYERETQAAVALWADHLRTLIEGGERKIVPFLHNESA
jgi:integrase